MPAYTILQLEDILGDYVESGALTFAQMMKQVLPRMYRMGMWPDLCYEVSLSGEHGYVSLPQDTAGVLACTVNDRPRPTRSLWHDVRISGRSTFLSSYTGIVDDGYYPVLLDMKEVQGVSEESDIADYPILFDVRAPGTLAAVAATDYAGTITLGYLGTDDASREGVQSVSGDLSITTEVEGSVATLTIAGGPFADSFTDSFTFPELLYYKETNGKPEYTDTGEAIPLVASGARVFWDGSQWVAHKYSTSFTAYEAVSSDPVDTPDLATFEAPTTGTGSILGLTLDAGVTAVACKKITSITYDAIPSPVVLIDPNFPTKIIAEIPAGSGVLRYRRFRTPEKDISCVVHLLLKRDSPTNISNDTVVHLGNIGAIKNAMLAIIDEDSADRARAKDSWAEVQRVLDEELQAVMGSAKPTLRLDFGPCPPIQSIM